MSVQIDPAFNNAALAELVADSALCAQLLQHHYVLTRAIREVGRLGHVEPPEDQPGQLATGFEFLLTYDTGWVTAEPSWISALTHFTTDRYAAHLISQLLICITLVGSLRQLFEVRILPTLVKMVDLALTAGVGPESHPGSDRLRSLCELLQEEERVHKPEEPTHG